MIRYGRYVLKEIGLGIRDNLRAIWQILRHPLLTFKAIFNAICHPIVTTQNILNFAWRSPWRFVTNIGLSILEGRLLNMGWQSLNASAPAVPAFETTSNTTLAVSEVALQESSLWQGFTNLFSVSKLPTTGAGYCSATHCTLPSATNMPTTAASASAAAAVLKNEAEKKTLKTT